ncbi:MAG TPA: hypothetical protein ENH56_16100 [Roseobacter sp.]|nr:hypothetical protein [Roseobacter sp.]
MKQLVSGKTGAIQRILQIKDEAPAVSEVQAHVWGESDGRSWSYKGTIRLIHEGEDDRSAVYGAEGAVGKLSSFS